MRYFCIFLFCFHIAFSFGQQTQSDALKSDVKLLLTPKAFDVKDKPLFFNGNDLVIIDDRKIFMLPIADGTNNSPSAGTIPKEINRFEQLIYSGNNAFIKDGGSISQLQDSTVNLFIKMPHKNFSIYPANEENFYVVIQENNKSDLFIINTETGKLLKLLSSPEKISDVVGTGERTIVAIGNDIFLLEEEETIMIHHNETPIKSLAGSEYGLFIASEKELSYLCLPFVVVPVIKENIQKVICANNTLIVLLKDGRLFKVDNANSFENSSNSERKKPC